MFSKLPSIQAALAEAGYDAELDMVVDGDEEEVGDIIAAVKGSMGSRSRR